ncbi:hypothetical protein PUNSTDRAFT_66094 [Punctularia strigosozonata HHB-11173 SS5]|uniref:uncharacterized protein n=1 Tax=Punctularia strigosozonata (strain HHB-11173) TaxID=741275 RepID=UPI0004417FA3|nr:uncharacterized protein PUNSTDRAFT_66094 [Punctularia strigosozonata HHB-11173 SS5]EIN09922.1 hypothetical protein PUNSTDRAFT_66094 [Punctularia strigosozonata HHB-11173 SS5]
MLGSIRTSWEQGTALSAVLEYSNPEYSLFGSTPFGRSGIPVDALQFAISAVARQTADGRLSQNVGDATDGAALDGASAGSGVLLGSLTDTTYKTQFANAAAAQLNYILTDVPRTSTGAISHRADSKQYWADGVFMGPPFIAYYGAVTQNQTLLQFAYDNCRLYRDALLLPNATSYGPLWGHIYDDDNKAWSDEGIWGTGNAWAATGMLRVLVTIKKSAFASNMTSQINDLVDWTEQILNGTYQAIGSDGLIPDYMSTLPDAHFGDTSSSAALASVYYRLAALYPDRFSPAMAPALAKGAATLRDAVLNGANELGEVGPAVDPLVWDQVGVVSTEGQAFVLMLISAWRDWLGA